jgi:hypothetical protein
VALIIHKYIVKSMKLQINSWHAVSTWTWSASDDTCGICRQAFDGCESLQSRHRSADFVALDFLN